MPLLGFSVFKEKVQDGTKKQTIRKLRKYPIKEGDKLFLYWHTRRPDCEKLGETTCTETYRISMSIDDEGELCIVHLPESMGNSWKLNFGSMQALAQLDGFNNVYEMRDWFKKTHSNLDGETFQVIRWNALLNKNKEEGQIP